MRQKISDDRPLLMRYEIREIVDVVQKIQELDKNFKFIGENIGDPVAKGWPVPPFLKEILIDAIKQEGDKIFGYTHSRGYPLARKWVCKYAKRFSPSANLDYEYVLFTSGLGAAISAIYEMLPHGKRILQPTPSYPTHASMESFNANLESVSYQLNPDNDWQPDIEDMEAKIKADENIVGILAINPNNPTGAVYSKETLEKIVALAEKYKLFIVSDEVYFRMVYFGKQFEQITEIANNRVPLLVMRGLSKDVPWPGGRCGWIEFHGIDLDPDYKKYCDAVKKRILLEVCSTTIPQMILEQMYEHPKFDDWNKEYNAHLEDNSRYIAETLSRSPYLKVNPTYGAFYMMPLFKEGVLNDRQTLPIENEEAKKYVEEITSKPGLKLDKRFVYYLLAATGICVVPASSFFSKHYGFRLTTLERDPAKRNATYEKVVEMIQKYVESAK
ncbi:MAG: aspartate transaminase [Candidatus Peregrinibacteria bacterium GW2011_GWF2_38_29]|nr:MAG: aspartate transaminase [Candidatus Peregrinibacteria bacterium GW2011_GWF2_38_29]HBB02384.1 aminotransferase [Candidatus Peregrinibacteria bacterium]